jgi:predicted membrane protein
VKSPEREERRSHELIGIVLTLVVVGVLLWLLNNYVPMDGKIRSIINVLVVIVVVIWVLQGVGLLGSLQNIRIR